MRQRLCETQTPSLSTFLDNLLFHISQPLERVPANNHRQGDRLLLPWWLVHTFVWWWWWWWWNARMLILYMLALANLVPNFRNLWRRYRSACLSQHTTPTSAWPPLITFFEYSNKTMHSSSHHPCKILRFKTFFRRFSSHSTFWNASVKQSLSTVSSEETVCTCVCACGSLLLRVCAVCFCLCVCPALPLGTPVLVLSGRYLQYISFSWAACYSRTRIRSPEAYSRLQRVAWPWPCSVTQDSALGAQSLYVYVCRLLFISVWLSLFEIQSSLLLSSVYILNAVH